MNSTSALALNYDDLLFLNKNKKYGAYTLRRSYKKNLFIALCIAITVFTLALSYPLLLKKEKVDNGIRGVTITTINLKNPTIEEKSTQPPIEMNPTPLKPSIRFVPPVVKPDKEVPEAEKIPTMSEMKNINPGIKTIQGDINGTDYIPETVPIENVDPVETIEKPFLWVEEMPRYRGDESEIYKFFGSNIRYPEIAKRAGVEGKVILYFIIDNDGSITNASVAKGIGAGCDEEALRVLGLMGKWSPGRQNGHPVRVVMTIPIVFKLQ